MDKQEPTFESAASGAEDKTESAASDAIDAQDTDCAGEGKRRNYPIAIYKPSNQYRRYALLAASLVIAAVLGGLIGSLSTYSLATTTPKIDLAASTQKLEAALAKVTKDVATLKTSVDTSNKSTTTQMAKIGERLDRSEKAQAEPAAKIAALTDTVSRIEKRLAATTTAAAAAGDITGSISGAKPQAREQAQMQPVGIPGWVLREARQGHAVVENRDTLYEIMPGAELPGVGRVQTITQQNGRWVVVTQKGLIVSVR